MAVVGILLHPERDQAAELARDLFTAERELAAGRVQVKVGRASP